MMMSAWGRPNPRRQRQSLLKVSSGLRSTEIQAVLGWPKSAVKTMLGRLRASLHIECEGRTSNARWSLTKSVPVRTSVGGTKSGGGNVRY